MFCEKAFRLIKDLQRAGDNLPAFNDDLVRQVLEEMQALYEQNLKDANTTVSGNASYFHGVHLRHTALERNQRCLLAYIYNRLQKIRKMRWEFGSILPADVKYNLSEAEIQWFSNYSKTLASYMRSIGDSHGLNLMQDLKPPKSLYIEVRCLVDYGKFELDDGEVIVLKKNSQHLLPRSQCELLIRQGILQHLLH